MIEMSENNINIGRTIDIERLHGSFIVWSARTLFIGWLGEMDGETTEEDWRIHPHHSGLDGKLSSPSFKKVSENSKYTIYH